MDAVDFVPSCANCVFWVEDDGMGTQKWGRCNRADSWRPENVNARMLIEGPEEHCLDFVTHASFFCVEYRNGQDNDEN